MITTSAGFKAAIKAPSRKIKAKLILPLDITLEQVDLIELDSYLSDEDDFIIGTANMDVMKIEVSDDPLSPLSYSFDGKEIDVQLGIELPDNSYEYHSLGKYTIEKSDRKDNKIYLDLVDRMYKADKQYISDVTYPATIHQILLSAAAQSGLTLETSTYANKDYIVNEEPVYEDISCRQVFAYVSELAGGFARINRVGALVIVNLGDIAVTDIDGDHYIDWKKSESAPGIIDRLIVKVGTEEASAGSGINIYTIVDNLFVQNPGAVTDSIFAVLTTMYYKAGELNWVGDFSLDMGDAVNIDSENTYIINRKIKYSGGLREGLKAPGKSNIEKDSTGKPNTNLQINKIKTQIKIQDGVINQKITEDALKFTEINQEIGNINLAVADKASIAEINVLSDSIESKVTQQQVQNLIDEVNRANPNLVTNFSENWEQGNISSSDGTMSDSTDHIRIKAYFPIRQGHVYIKVSPLYQAMIVLYDSDYSFKASYGFATEQTFLLDENCYFKVVLRRTNLTAIETSAIDTAELKVENSDVATQYTPYYGDLTLDQQQDYFTLSVESSNGWTVDEPGFSATFTAKIYLFNEDVTMRFEPLQFTWYKQYPDGQLISLGNGTTKVITGSSLEKSATISCVFEIYDTIYTLATFNGDTLLTVANQEIMVIGYL